MDRQEAVDLEAPKMVQAVERLIKGKVVGIFIIADENGVSVVGNCSTEGLTHYLQWALDCTTGQKPDRLWKPPSSGH